MTLMSMTRHLHVLLPSGKMTRTQRMSDSVYQMSRPSHMRAMTLFNVRDAQTHTNDMERQGSQPNQSDPMNSGGRHASWTP